MSRMANEGNRQDLNVSIIIPVKNEEANLAKLADEIGNMMYSTSWSWECLWIDDGSTDNTLYELRQINRKDAHHHFIALSRNYGQSAALSVGFRHSRGEILVTLDGDGQNNPVDIPPLIRTLLEGDADMVNGWRRERKDNLTRKISSRIGNTFRNWITNERIRDVGCSLRVFRRGCVEHIPVFKGMHRFLPTLARIGGYSKIVEMPVCHRPRLHGQAKYDISNRFGVGLIDTLVVRWMQSRLVYPDVRFVSWGGGSGEAG